MGLSQSDQKMKILSLAINEPCDMSIEMFTYRISIPRVTFEIPGDVKRGHRDTEKLIYPPVAEPQKNLFLCMRSQRAAPILITSVLLLREIPV